LSTKAGWAYFEIKDNKLALLESGQVIPISEIKGPPYPESYLKWADAVMASLLEVMKGRPHAYLITEETTSGSKNNFDQKILEWVHLRFAEHCVSKMKEGSLKNVHYFMTGEWRSVAGMGMTIAESKRNKYVKLYKKAHGVKIAKDADGKVMGKVTKKHQALRRVKELFGLNLKVKDNDEADALLLGYAGFKRFFEKDNNELTKTKGIL